MLDDTTLREVFHFRVSLLGAISFITLSILVIIILLSVLIVYTPLRNILPGYSASLREQLVDESARVDSLQADLRIQRQYLDMIKGVVAGDIETDSVQSLDSMQRVEKAKITVSSSEATEAFISQYEQKERDMLLLFDNTTVRSARQYQRPARGVPVRSALPDQRVYSVAVRVAKSEPVMAITRGTLVSIDHLADNTFALTLQHGGITSIYRHVGHVLKTQGTTVEAGESIGMMDGEHDLEVEIWDAGQFVNPEEVIVW